MRKRAEHLPPLPGPWPEHAREVTVRLGFTIEQARPGGARYVVPDTGGHRPATHTECALWDELCRALGVEP